MSRFIAIALALLACGPKPRTAAEEFGDWAPKDADKAWQGAWILRFVYDGPLVAVNITGDKATVFDGQDEKQVTFKLIEPCAVAIGSHEIQYLVKDGVVVSGRGAVGYRKGDKAIACGDGRDPGAPEEGVFTVTGNRCTSWKRGGNNLWSGRDGVCVWANARGDDLLDVGTEHYYSSLVVKGDLLEEREFTKSAKEHVRATSWDEAKAVVSAKRGKPSALDTATAAGGVVGDTRTIAGLHATYAQHPASLVGQTFEIAGTLVETSTGTALGKVTTLAVISDPSNPKSMQLLCEITGAVEIAAGTPVVIKGSIDTRFDHARLRSCTITSTAGSSTLEQ